MHVQYNIKTKYSLYLIKVTATPYRFPVYPVNKCPRNKTEFQTSAERRNCIGGSRYLCAPNKYMSSLIEFCTDRKRSLFGTGVRSQFMYTIIIYYSLMFKNIQNVFENFANNSTLPLQKNF